jgi:hypothetical protein
MSLISKLKTEVEAFGLQYIYDSNGGINKMLDYADYSDGKCVVYSFLLSQSKLIDGIESATIGMFFSKITEFDFESIENDTLQQECKEIAFEFIKYISSGNVLSISSDITMTYFYDEFDANVTGVAINATLTEMVGLCYNQTYYP